jgi:Flp pilus assembly protein protease CpaA
MIVFYFLAAILVVVAVQFIRGADVALMTAAARVLINLLAAVSFPYGVATSLAVFGDLHTRDAAAADVRAAS